MRIPVRVTREMSGGDERDYFSDRAPSGDYRDDYGYGGGREEREPEEDRSEQREPERANRDCVGGNGGDVDWKNLYVREKADFENFRRNADIERTRLTGLGKEMVLDDLFPLVEHMERALEAARNAGESNGILQGLELVYGELLKVLAKNGVERVATVGEPFDPAMHEAVSAIPHPEYEEGTVVAEVKPGFVRNGKLLRAACVVVAR